MLTMGKFLICFVVLTVLYAVQGLSSNCPLSSKMTTCSPKCKDDTECFGLKCCPNICNTKSCVPANLKDSSSSSKYSGSNGGGTGSYCGNVKCNSFERCQLDPSTKRQRCVRA